MKTTDEATELTSWLMEVTPKPLRPCEWLISARKCEKPSTHRVCGVTAGSKNYRRHVCTVHYHLGLGGAYGWVLDRRPEEP